MVKTKNVLPTKMSNDVRECKITEKNVKSPILWQKTRYNSANNKLNVSSQNNAHEVFNLL